MRYSAKAHSARHTDDFVFSQLIPYIGNKRKLLPLIQQAIDATGLNPQTSSFLDAFSGSTVVSRFAKRLGFAVTANDWEPYAEVLAQCFVACNADPVFFGSRSYESVVEELNSLPPFEGWIAKHLCPRDDEHFDLARDRMFYMRKNGMRLDAIRERIAQWESEGLLSLEQRASLLGPLLYQACWLSNTSGVFKAFHRGWGGQTGTALYRIGADLHIRPALFLDNERKNTASGRDAQSLALQSQHSEPYDIAYLDPPYNQHPYGSNYHVLNSLTLWDQPELPTSVEAHGKKSAIRQDWRTERRSAYNHRSRAAVAYSELIDTLNARFLCTSYSTDGLMPLRELITANLALGEIRLLLQGYKRYRVSSQRFSARLANIEFVLLTDTSRKATRSAESYVHEICEAETALLSTHAKSHSKGSALNPGVALPAAPDTDG